MKSTEIRATYIGCCPNCGGDITDNELLANGVCRECLSEQVMDRFELYEKLSSKGRLMKIKQPLEVSIWINEFKEFFKRLVGSYPWSLQETWARRVYLGRSFSIVAPTGMGKSIFGLIMCIYLAIKGQKSYFIVPSSLLVQHFLDKANMFLEKLEGKKPVVIGYYSGMPKKDSEEILDRVRKGEFDILITTDRFLYSRFEILKHNNFSFIFVDDVDSFLKSPKNIDKVVMLMGYEPEIIDKVMRIIEIRRKKRPTEGEIDELDMLEESMQNYDETRGKILVVSGATLRGIRTKRMQLFRYLFGFQPGYSFEFVRNITNFVIRPSKTIEEEVYSLIKKYGSGCLIFVPQIQGTSYALRLSEYLNEKKIPVHAYSKMNPKMISLFTNGHYQALIGVASNRSPLARGIDLPENIRYVIFAGVPRREIRISKDEYDPAKLLTLLRNISPLIDDPLSTEVQRIVAMLSKTVPTHSEVIEKVREAINNGADLSGFEAFVLQAVKEARKLIQELLTEDRVKTLSERADIYIKALKDEYRLIIPDVDGFIQASGRTSRLYAGGISKGISFIIVDDEKALHGLLKRVKLVYEDESIIDYSESIAAKEFEKVDEDRRKIISIRKGEFKAEELDIIKSALMIVESPTKARTIATFFGRPVRRRIGALTVYESLSGEMVLTIAACQGHIFDLTTIYGFHGINIQGKMFIPNYTFVKRCLRCGEQFTDHDKCPECGSEEVFSKKEIMDSLKQLAMEANKVLIATDPDAEGEKIGYDLYCNLYPYNSNIMRLVFHEVTRKALRSSLTQPERIRISLVDSQTVRRIEDRWLGFELSRKLWERFGRKTLSAGRVQTPVLGWIIERVEEAKKKKTVATFWLENELRIDFIEPRNLEDLKEKANSGELFAEVEVPTERLETVHPPPPYTTDSLLRDASIYLRLSSSETMRIAQTLFESGLITYHRTDATTVSNTGLSIAQQYIDENYPGMFKPRTYKSEGAHECIRPTRPISKRQLEFYLRSGVMRFPLRLGEKELRLYDLIFNRFIASQMVDAVVTTQELVINIDDNISTLNRVVSIIELGFLKVLPTIKAQEKISPGRYRVVRLELRRVPSKWLLSEGELISMMKQKGIGRPSTYSRIIELLYSRGYIFQNNGRLLNTRLGKLVYEYLSSKYGDLVSEELTKKLEETMDRIENNEINYQDVLMQLYNDISRLLAEKH
ncbi:MAG: reverse gyrase [Nitrososphaerota archaeon]